MQNYYHPGKNHESKSKKIKTKITPGQKTFNQAYIDIILRSKKFREESENYLME